MFSPFTLQGIVFSSLSFVVAYFLFKLFLSSSKSHKNLPPSPRKLPLFGNLHQLGSSPHRSLQAMAQTYGPLMLLHFGTVPVLVASSAELAKQILKTHDITFAGRPYTRIADKMFYGSKDIGFSQCGEYWRQIKSIAVLHLLSNKRVQSYHQVREDEVGRMLDKIRKAGESAFNLSELLITLTNNVVCRVALGRTYEGRKFKHLLVKTLELLGSFSVGSYVPSLWWVDLLTGLDRSVNKITKEFDEFLEGVIEEHVNKKEVSVEGRDLVDILLELHQTDNDDMNFHLERDMIKAIIKDIFVAGTDTTFTVLEWTVCELLRHPLVMKKLQKEASEIGQGRSMIIEDDLEKMPYLKAVLKESLRLHIPSPLLLPHETTQDIKLLGYDIPSRTQVLVNAWAIARDPSIWEHPEEFKPDRFLHSPIDYKGFHYELLPFGAGRRRCPGIQFAMNIDEVALANLVYRFDLTLVGKEGLMSETSGVTAQKKIPLLVSATPRS